MPLSADSVRRGKISDLASPVVLERRYLLFLQVKSAPPPPPAPLPSVHPSVCLSRCVCEQLQPPAAQLASLLFITPDSLFMCGLKRLFLHCFTASSVSPAPSTDLQLTDACWDIKHVATLVCCCRCCHRRGGLARLGIMWKISIRALIATGT